MKLEIIQYLALQDNYNYLIREPESGFVATIDPSEAAPTRNKLQEKGWSLQMILNTHHHPDHIGGNKELEHEFRPQVYAPSYDEHRIAGAHHYVSEGDTVKLGELELQVMYLPGHTSGHIAYYIPEAKSLFCGDVLFSLGCGRLFEGSPEEMFTSLKRIRNLPDDTKIYCAHEYTEANGEFALTLEADNSRLIDRVKQVRELRAKGLPTVPSTLKLEKATNPFLRWDALALRVSLGLEKASDLEVFTETRRRKDHF